MFRRRSRAARPELGTFREAPEPVAAPETLGQVIDRLGASSHPEHARTIRDATRAVIVMVTPGSLPTGEYVTVVTAGGPSATEVAGMLSMAERQVFSRTVQDEMLQRALRDIDRA